MKRQQFASLRLGGDHHRQLQDRLAQHHDAEPFLPTDPRRSVERVIQVGQNLGLQTYVIRGGVDLRGVEVDHVWASVEGAVIDVAYPLLHHDFVDVLRRFVAGDAENEELEGAAVDTEFTQRIFGEFPESLRYMGARVWTQRAR